MKNKEKYNVTIHTNGDGFEINLANGKIDVPDTNGGYVISTGCGAGKTESIKSLIRQKADSGIVYCVDTISELQKMYQWIINNLCSTGVLAEDDVVCISSDLKNSQELKKYKGDPSYLITKKVILLTHVRFWTDLINYFVVYNPTSAQEPPFDCDFQKLMARNDLRKYIIFDETPLFIKPFVTIPKCFLAVLGKPNKKGEWHSVGRNEMDDRYEEFIKNSPQDLFKDNSELSKIKRKVVLDMIYKNYDSYMEKATKDGINITFKPIMLCQPGINNHILIYEGVGDVLFQGSKSYQTLDINTPKYDGKMLFQQIPKNKRRYESYSDKDKKDVADSITNLINSLSGKTLVVVWQTVGKNARDKSDINTSAFVEDLKKLINTNNYYDITYFGSNLTKSTNHFRDFDNIILWGAWHITNQETAKFRNHYGTFTENAEHQMWYYIQLLCRIGIRNHNVNNKVYDVFYTDDYDANLIKQLEDYFNNQYQLKTTKQIMRQIIETKLKNKGIRKTAFNNIIQLANQDANVMNAIMKDKPYSLSMTLKQLYNKVPIGKTMKKDNYKSFIENLNKLGITFKWK